MAPMQNVIPTEDPKVRAEGSVGLDGNASLLIHRSLHSLRSVGMTGCPPPATPDRGGLDE